MGSARVGEGAVIDLFTASNVAIQGVNPNIVGTFYANTGFTVGASKKQIPTFAGGVNVPMQVQAIDAKDLRHLENMNVEEVVRSVHMYGNTQGVVRVNRQGGDLLYFEETPGSGFRVWKVIKVRETWPDWCRVIVALQTDSAPPSPPPP